MQALFSETGTERASRVARLGIQVWGGVHEVYILLFQNVIVVSSRPCRNVTRANMTNLQVCSGFAIPSADPESRILIASHPKDRLSPTSITIPHASRARKPNPCRANTASLRHCACASCDMPTLPRISARSCRTARTRSAAAAAAARTTRAGDPCNR